MTHLPSFKGVGKKTYGSECQARRKPDIESFFRSMLLLGLPISECRTSWCSLACMMDTQNVSFRSMCSTCLPVVVASDMAESGRRLN